MYKSNVKKSITKSEKKINKKLNYNFSTIGKIAFYHKHYNYLLSQKYLSVAREYNDYYYQQLAFRVYNCSNFVKYAQFSNQKQKIITMHSCNDRLCMTCNYRRSQRTFAKLIRVIKSDDFVNKKYKLIFLTLTLENVPPNELNQAINHIFYSFKKFMLNKRIAKMSKGFFRALEITFNEKDRTFHHHLHIIFVVNKSYFDDSKQYLKQSDFTDIWQSSAALDYTPVVFVEKIKDNKGLAEVSKYSVKANDKFIKELTNYEFKTLRDELANRRLVSMGGVVRDIAKKLKLNLDDNDIKSDDLTDDDIKDETLQAIISLRWSVGFGKYQLVEKEKVGF